MMPARDERQARRTQGITNLGLLMCSPLLYGLFIGL